jgi:hypothetical protein
MAIGLTVPQKLRKFIYEWKGKIAVGDTAGNKGQCVGLVEEWIDTLGLPHVWGNAADLLANADTTHYRKVSNAPTNFPIPGDIVVWDRTWGNGDGHTAICITGAVMSFTAFEQNDPDGSTPHMKLYTYDGVMGWLRPYVRS